MVRTTLPVLVLSAVLLSGCAAYTAAMYGTGEASADFIQCRKDNAGYETIPDFGITHRQHFLKCMREAGWEKLPDTPEGPSSYRRVVAQ